MHQLDKLIIWKKSMELAKMIYSQFPNKAYPSNEPLIYQLKKTAISIPSNIAEGFGRNSKKETLYFLNIANGSSYELQTQVILSNEFNLIKNESAKSILNLNQEIQKINYALQKQFKQQINQ